MNANISRLYDNLLQLAASSQTLGINLIRVAILIVFVWIGGLKFQNYEAEGIVPFVANSPFMSFFYTQKAPEYKNYKLKEGEFDAAKHEWHVRNNTYGFSHGLGILIMAIGVLVFLGIFSARIGLAGAILAVIMTVGTLSFLVTTPEVWVPDLGSGEAGFPWSRTRLSSPGHSSLFRIRPGASCGKGTQTGYKTVNPERAPGTIPRAPRDEPAIRKSMISGNARYCICTSSRRSKPSTTDPLLTYK